MDERRQYSENIATDIYHEQLASHGRTSQGVLQQRGAAARATDVRAQYPPGDQGVCTGEGAGAELPGCGGPTRQIELVSGAEKVCHRRGVNPADRHAAILEEYAEHLALERGSFRAHPAGLHR